MKKIFKLLSLLFCFTLFSCAQQGGETQSSFQIGVRDFAAVGDSGQFPGGLMLFGKSGNRSFGRVLTSEIKDEMIPNGVWDFYVIGWDEASSGAGQMSGTAYCAVQKGVTLMGEPTIINLNATNLGCARPVFGKTFTENGKVRFAKLDVKTCNDLSDTSLGCKYNFDITTDPVTYINSRGVARSYRVVAKSFNAIGLAYSQVEGAGLHSACGEVSEASSEGVIVDGSDFSQLNIPAGTPGSPFSMVLRAYLGSSNCVEHYGVIDVPMLKGASPNHARAVTELIGNTNNIYARTTVTDVCNRPEGSQVEDSNGDLVSFRGGSGTEKSPFIICDGAELNSIKDQYLTSSFMLGKDIDLNPYTAVVNQDIAPTCAERGENFHPIGVEFDNDVNCVIVSNGFGGVFDGNGHVIKGLRIEGKENDHMGFIGKLNGTLMNVVFDQAGIEGKKYVGLVGELETAGKIFNIEIYRSHFETSGENSGAWLGSVAGKSSGSIKKAFLKGVNVTSDQGSYVGGAVGASSGGLEEISFHGRVDSKDGDKVGGVVGLNDNGALVSVASRGSVHAEGNYIGGVAGYSTAAISSSYSHMYLQSEATTNISIGGIVGDGGNKNLSNSYFSGQISCASTCDSEPLGNNVTATESQYLNKSHSIGGITETALIAPHNDFVATKGYSEILGSYPILKFEKEKKPICASASALLSISAQSGDEKKICNLDQLKYVLKNSNSGETYVLGESLNVGDLDIGNEIAPFYGVFDGKGNSLVNVKFTNTSLGPGGVFKEITQNSVVKNLSLLGAKFYASGAGGDIGLLAAKNEGEIQNVTASGSLEVLSGSHYHGLLVGINNRGTIQKSMAYGKIEAPGQSGGLVGKNIDGEIKYSQSHFKFIANLNGSSEVGGLVGVNEGTIIESLSSADIDTKSGLSDFTAFGDIGLFAGINSGSISDSMVKEGDLLVKAGSQNAGGFVGDNSGGADLVRNISFGKVLSDSLTGASTFGGLVGIGDIGSKNLFQFEPARESTIDPNYAKCDSTDVLKLVSINTSLLSERFNKYTYFEHSEGVIKTKDDSTFTATATNNLSFNVFECSTTGNFNPKTFQVLDNYNQSVFSRSYHDLRSVDEFKAAWGQEAAEFNSKELVDAHFIDNPYDPEFIYPMAWEVEEGKKPRLLNIR